MASPSENTPLLAGDDRQSSHHENQVPPSIDMSKKSPFNLSIAILRILISVLSLSLFAILLAAYILIVTGPFDYVSNSQQAVRIVAIIVLLNFVLSTLAIFLKTLSLFNVPLNFTIAIILLVFSEHLIGDGWPDVEQVDNLRIFCIRRGVWAPGRGWEENSVPGCVCARDVIKSLMGVSAGFGILIALLLMAEVVLELTAPNRDGMKFEAQISGESEQTGASIRAPNANSDLH